jgi:hypothetical protein
MASRDNVFVCPPGYENDIGFLCYKKCDEGYNGVAFVCWSSCNFERNELGELVRNDGGDWRDDGAMCGKRLYDRGVGTLPDACQDGRDMFMGMCYVPCRNGLVATTWAATTCSQQCPPNTTEGGFANCTKQNSYGRGTGNQGNGCDSGYTNMGLYCYRWWLPDSRAFNCPASDENWGGLCYPKCAAGFNAFGCCVCSPSCGALRDDGATCHREWYDRGIGVVPNACSDDDKGIEEGLCYAKCKDKFNSFATTCTRGGCPAHSLSETALTCNKRTYPRDTLMATPNVADKLSAKLDVKTMSSTLRRVALNAIVIVCCLLGVFVILVSNGLLRGRAVRVKL